ncbi:MAG: LysM repeat protein [Flavobacteriales bacterium]|jgi:LysM repeat protein
MMKSIIATIISLSLTLALFATDKRISRNEYIDQWKDAAIYQMVVHKIPASITLAQGILESGDGNSRLAQDANNHFGIKCHSDWTGDSVREDDDKKNECFRKYDDAADSFNDHADFLMKKRYASLFDLRITDYKGWAKGLKKCGYATNPKYAHRLIDIIEANDLEIYDEEGLSMIKNGAIPTDLAELDKSAKKKVKKKEERRVPKQSSEDDNLPGVEVSFSRPTLFSDNKVLYVLAKNGDTFNTIAEDLDLMPWQIKKYNDFEDSTNIEEGEIVYVKPKRNRAKSETHTLQEGETMHDVSQRYGIKLSALYKKNNLSPGTAPIVGTELSLQKRVRPAS